MAHIETSDFSRAFKGDFDRDLDYLADKANDAIIELAEKHGGQFDEIERNFNAVRPAFMKVYETIVYGAYFDYKDSMEDIVKDAPFAALVLLALEIDSRRFGSADADDFIKEELDGNPYLEDVEDGGSSRSRRDIQRRSLSRSSRNRSSGREERSTRTRTSSRRSSRSRDDYDDKPKRRGRLAKREREESNDAPRERNVEVERVTKIEPKVKIGDVVTSANFVADENTIIAPVYLIGHEQVILTEEGLKVVEYTGTNEVDYEKHRIDRFFPDILGGKNAANELSLIALREAEKVKDQTISGYVTNPDNPNEVNADPKLFMYLKSATYTTPLTQHALSYDPNSIRNLIIEEHNGDITWFANHALNVCIIQSVPVMNCSNDGIERLKALWECKQMHVVVQYLYELATYIDVAAWKFIHDTLTDRLNARLLRNNLNINLDSITADWDAFKDLIATQYPNLAEMQNMTIGVFDGFECNVETLEDESKDVTLRILRNTVYLPIPSFDLDLGSPSIVDNCGVLLKDSIMFNVVKDHFTTSETGTSIYLVTTDNLVLEVLNASSMVNPQLYIMRVFKQ